MTMSIVSVKLYFERDMYSRQGQNKGKLSQFCLITAFVAFIIRTKLLLAHFQMIKLRFTWSSPDQQLGYQSLLQTSHKCLKTSMQNSEINEE